MNILVVIALTIPQQLAILLGHSGGGKYAHKVGALPQGNALTWQPDARNLWTTLVQRCR